MKSVIAVSGSVAGNITKRLEKIAFIIGQEIAKKGAILLTGACPGLPYGAARGAKAEGGLVVGVSPAENKNEHLQKYHYPAELFDVLVYSGFGLKGRNVIFVRSADALICIAGRTGTLNEFAIAYDEGKPIGVLQPDGISELIPKIVKISGKGMAPVIYETEPKKLVVKLIKLLHTKLK